MKDPGCGKAGEMGREKGEKGEKGEGVGRKRGGRKQEGRRKLDRESRKGGERRGMENKTPCTPPPQLKGYRNEDMIGSGNPGAGHSEMCFRTIL